MWEDMDAMMCTTLIEAIKDLVQYQSLPLNAWFITGHVFHNSIYGNNKKYWSPNKKIM